MQHKKNILQGHGSRDTCHLSPTPTSTAADPPLLTHSLIVGHYAQQAGLQRQTCLSLGTSLFTPKPKNISKRPKKFPTLQKYIIFATLAIRSSTRILQSPQCRVPVNSTEPQNYETTDEHCNIQTELAQPKPIQSICQGLIH